MSWTTWELYSSSRAGILLLVVGIIVAAGIYLHYRQIGSRLGAITRAVLVGLRVFALVLLLLILLEPVLAVVREEGQKPLLAVLVDASESMAIEDDGVDRLERARQTLQNTLLEPLSKAFEVRLYRFAETLQPLRSPSDSALLALGSGTALGDALYQTQQELGEQLGGVLLLTDGGNNLGRDPVKAAEALGRPVYLIGIGDTRERKDVAITRYRTNEVTYVRSRVPVEVTIRSSGMAGMRVPVLLKQGKEVLDTNYLLLSQEAREQSLLFHFEPKREGIQRYTVTIPLQEGETIGQNNTQHFSVKVLKNKIAVLYLEGAARYEVGFLRRTLEKDTNIDVTTLVGRKEGDFYPHPLPNTAKELYPYDLVILGNLPYDRLGPERERLIVSFVQDRGGALLMLGGPDSFDGGGYEATALGQILPITMSTRSSGLIESEFVPQLTEEGQSHPIFQWDEDPLQGGALWQDLPPLPGTNRSTGAKPGATVLAVHPSWKAGSQPMPVMAVQRYGAGKTMAITAYGLWRWNFRMLGVGKTNTAYEHFWSNLVRWLTSPESGKRIRLVTDKTRYRSGQPINFSGQVYDESYRPVDDATFGVELRGKADSDNPLGEPITLVLTSSKNQPGLYAALVQALPPGEYSFVGKVEHNGVVLGTDSGYFTVGAYSLEYHNARLNRELLQRMAVASGGCYYDLTKGERMAEEINLEPQVLTHRAEIRLGDNPLILALVIGCLSLEWFLRKQRGLE